MVTIGREPTARGLKGVWFATNLLPARTGGHLTAQ